MNKIEYWTKKVISKDLIYKQKINNVYEIPNFKKVSLKISSNKTVQNLRTMFLLISILEILVNQKAKICFAKKSISNFKIQSNMPLSCKLTLRKKNKNKFFQLFLCFIFPKLNFQLSKKNKFFLNVGLKDLFFLPHFSIINNFLMRDLGLSFSINFNKKKISLLLSSFHLKGNEIPKN